MQAIGLIMQIKRTVALLKKKDKKSERALSRMAESPCEKSSWLVKSE